jgi:hypothetical protein
MCRPLLALTAFACAATIGGVPLSLGQTPKFEGVYKGRIVLTSAVGGGTGGGGYSSCQPSTNKFEQIMTVSGDRLYLIRKAVQLNTVITGIVSPEGTVSGSGLMTRSDNQSINIMQMLTGKIENDQFTGSIIDRFCSYSVQLKK